MPFKSRFSSAGILVSSLALRMRAPSARWDSLLSFRPASPAFRLLCGVLFLAALLYPAVRRVGVSSAGPIGALAFIPLRVSSTACRRLRTAGRSRLRCNTRIDAFIPMDSSSWPALNAFSASNCSLTSRNFAATRSERSGTLARTYTVKQPVDVVVRNIQFLNNTTTLDNLGFWSGRRPPQW